MKIELPPCKLSAPGSNWEWAKIECQRQCGEDCHIEEWLKTQWFNTDSTDGKANDSR